MHFAFNEYSVSLLFGFVQAWLFAILFWVRGKSQGRLSDVLFGGLLVALAFEIWEYMLGFAGIEILWNELEFFPRTLSFLLPPLAYFYLKSQFNSDFHFRRRDLLHLLPFAVYLVYHVAVFACGRHAVQWWQQHVHYPLGIDTLQTVAKFGQQFVYFYWALRLYRDYRRWAPEVFSDTDTVNFTWFRNFLIAFLAMSVFNLVMLALDMALDLDFWHDWWSELFVVALIYYLSISGYTQVQPKHMTFRATETEIPDDEIPQQRPEKMSETELQQLKNRLEQLMQQQRPYLEPELSLADLARRLSLNASQLSAVVNTGYGKNFNDFVNEYRVRTVKTLLEDPKYSHLSLLAIGLEAGFNSKATFNRAFKKLTGVAPGDYLKARTRA